jgi:uncharacterized membrane protein YeaQ/YmgE (transglycosylase-associated protein family)
MHFMWAVVIGIMVGVIANLLRPGHAPRRMLGTMGIGAGGAVLAAVLGRGLGFRAASGHPGIGLYLSVGIMWCLLAASALIVSRRPT